MKEFFSHLVLPRTPYLGTIFTRIDLLIDPFLLKLVSAVTPLSGYTEVAQCGVQPAAAYLLLRALMAHCGFNLPSLDMVTLSNPLKVPSEP